MSLPSPPVRCASYRRTATVSQLTGAGALVVETSITAAAAIHLSRAARRFRADEILGLIGRRSEQAPANKKTCYRYPY